MSVIEVERRQSDRVAWVWMNRAEIHNAFDETLIAELTAMLRQLDGDSTARVVVLAGRGKSFSAGADLNWMRRQGMASQAENLADAKKLAELFRTLAEMKKPTVARVHGPAMAGGMGLAAACDICVASDNAIFATSEEKLGIIPAVISPYVIRAIGERQSYRYFQTAERLSAKRAHELGLVHEMTTLDQLDATLQSIIDALLTGGPLSQAASTELIRSVANRPVTPELIHHTAVAISSIRASDEAKEGLTAFLEKRAPSWVSP